MAHIEPIDGKRMWEIFSALVENVQTLCARGKFEHIDLDTRTKASEEAWELLQTVQTINRDRA